MTVLTPVFRIDLEHLVADSIELSDDRCRGRVGDRDLTAENPRELQNQMAAAVYDVLHAGQRLQPPGHPQHLRDRDFEAVLTAGVPHRSTVATGIVRVPAVPSSPVPEDAVLVEREGVRVWVPTSALDRADPVPGDTVTFALAATRPALSPGFLVTDASRGIGWAEPVLRVYVHLVDVDAAAAVWGAALEHLEQAGTRYRAKVLSAPRLYPRRDALVVYLPQSHWGTVDGLAEHLGSLPGLGDDASAFTLRAGRGVALACEPDDPDPARRGLSFGQHRASVLVHALFTAKEEGTDPVLAVASAFAAANIDAEAPYRNTDSPSLPGPRR